MGLRDFLDGEEEDIRNAVAIWWITRGEKVMAERVGQLIRTRGVFQLFIAMKAAGEIDRFTEACAKSFHVDEETAKIVRCIYTGHAEHTREDPVLCPSPSAGA